MRKALSVLFAQTQVGLLSFHLGATGIRESQDLEFRAEFFNFLNHPRFARPDPYITDGPGVTGRAVEAVPFVQCCDESHALVRIS
jgi:hypothetical protein